MGIWSCEAILVTVPLYSRGMAFSVMNYASIGASGFEPVQSAGTNRTNLCHILPVKHLIYWTKSKSICFLPAMKLMTTSSGHDTHGTANGMFSAAQSLTFLYSIGGTIKKTH
jgi:hypothetical protein